MKEAPPPQCNGWTVRIGIAYDDHPVKYSFLAKERLLLRKGHNPLAYICARFM